ncbi:DUF2510 domain-containing protein [Streptomyces mangrovisoli]|uniref:DUF2510 domain-containing protein n=1 Tax=Streptomyces mangrovisoli TaxID=1428628 RepID=A0A1J4NQ73_9ACTN|nr:DUF2510 domain-containing protein [Streptomyces mangrovisoli]OIJ64527.1 hypothetical protein WN71_028615 [Streptomyces mangrovisoli]
MTTPPGWYRDPAAAHQERWWDGADWTEHRRTPQAPWQQPPPVPEGPGRAKAVALVSACAVLVVAIVTGVSALGQGGRAPNGDPRADGAGSAPPTAPPSATPAPSATRSSAPPRSPTARPSPHSASPAPASRPPSRPTSGPSRPTAPPGSPAPTPSYVVDELNGITLPLLHGWVPAQDVTEPDAVMTTDGVYDCPGDPGPCHHGLVISRTATASGATSVRTLATQDVPAAAEEAYDRDPLGRRPYGGLESHQVVASGPVTVAGAAGYYVRWRIRTADGPGGYVQSLAFRSRTGSRTAVVVRYVFDAGPDGPALTEMDRITKGIRPTG